MSATEFRQFGELAPEDFDRHRVWILCHTADYKKPWYKDVDVDTFRPWTEVLPAIVLRETLLVRAEFELWDRNRAIPDFEHSWWKDMTRFRTADVSENHDILSADYNRTSLSETADLASGAESSESRSRSRGNSTRLLARSPSKYFPYNSTPARSSPTGVLSGVVEGFYRRTRDRVVKVERAEPESPDSKNLANVLHEEHDHFGISPA